MRKLIVTVGILMVLALFFVLPSPEVESREKLRPLPSTEMTL